MWAFDMFNYFVPTMKIKVQNLSTKASSPRVYGSEGPSHGLCGGAKEERELPTVCAQEVQGFKGCRSWWGCGDSGGRGSPRPARDPAPELWQNSLVQSQTVCPKIWKTLTK